MSGTGRQDPDDAVPVPDRSKFTRAVTVEMPDVGDDMEGVIERWYVEEGDLIRSGDAICDIKTELVIFGMITDDSYDSIMGEIRIPAGSAPIKPGTVLCTTLNEGGSDEEDEEADTDESKYHEVFEGSDWQKK